MASRTACLLAATLATALSSTSASAQLSKVMLLGESAPNGGTFSYPGSAFASYSGHVLFRASTSTGGCIFRFDRGGGGGTPLFCEGGVAPLPDAETWASAPTYFAASRSGDLVFKGSYLDTSQVLQHRILYRARTGLLSEVEAISSTGSLYATLNDSGQLLFRRGGSLVLIETPPAGPGTTIVTTSDPLPDEPGRYFQSFAGPAALGPEGEVAFGVWTWIPPDWDDVTFALYWVEDGTLTRIATGGSALPGGAVAGTLTWMEFLAFDGVGNLFGRAGLSGGTHSGEIVGWTGSAWESAAALAVGEDATSLLGAAADGDLLYQTTTGPSLLSLYAKRAGVASLVASTGQSAPGADGATFFGFPMGIASPPGGMVDDGFAVTAALSSNGRGIYSSGRPPPKSTPALSPPAAAALALTIGVVACRRLRGSRRRPL